MILFLRLKLLKFQDMIDYKIAITMFKARIWSSPLNVQNIFTVIEKAAYSNYQEISMHLNLWRAPHALKKVLICIEIGLYSAYFK